MKKRKENLASSTKLRQQQRKKWVFYISPNGNDKWSGKMATANRSNTNGPFATIEKARNAIRALKADKKLTRPVTVYIRDGLYQLRKPVLFTPKDSGTEECPVTYMAYPGETPVVSGGRRIKSWKQEKNGLWKTKVPGVREGQWYFKQLFVNGKRRYRSRLPKKGFYKIIGSRGVENEPDKKPMKQFRFALGDLKSNWTNLSDVEVVALHFWVDVHLPIATVDEGAGVVTFTRSSRQNLALDSKEDGERYRRENISRYYVDNVLEALSVPGEWYLNRVTGMLYYLAEPGEDVEHAEIFAPRLVNLVRFEGNPETGRFVEHISLRRLTFSHNEWELPPDDAGDHQAADAVPGAIYGRGVRNCIIGESNIKNIGTYGIELTEGCNKNRVIRNEISEAGGGGIKISGGDSLSPITERTGKNIVADNHLHHLGQIFPSAVGILARHTSENNIAHNHIHHFYYTGISIGWVWSYAPSVSRDNRIEFNHIHHIGQGMLGDMAGIYTLGVSPGTVIRNNLIHDVEAYSYNGLAIYLDQGSSHIIIENNICYDTSHVVFNRHYGRENVVRNNIFAFGRQGQVFYGRAEEHTGLTFERNIVITNGQPIFLSVDKKFFISDLNLFWEISGKRPNIGQVEGKVLKMPGWQKIGADLHSIVTEPGCKNLDKRDFRLKRNSAAAEIGFKPIDISQVGQRKR